MGLKSAPFHWSVKPVHIDDFDYELPEALIAQHPTSVRTHSRLLHVTADSFSDGLFVDVLELCQPGDLLVVNNTKVVKARLFGQKDSGGQAELLLERLLGQDRALFQIRVSKPLKAGRTMSVGDQTLTCVGRHEQFYEMQCSGALLPLLDAHGSVPLPPYIERSSETDDSERYQTVFNKVDGAVAAPTAGLHFDEELLAQLRAKGVAITEVTLHVGAGTFQPVRGELQDHVMHQERYWLGEEVAEAIAATKAKGGRVIAVGTTVVRTLESVALENDGSVVAAEGETQLFIKPGFEFQVVDRLITNFHLPKSTLMMLVSAFSGRERIMSAYQHAVDKEYRFFSYGDAMWLERAPHV